MYVRMYVHAEFRGLRCVYVYLYMDTVLHVILCVYRIWTTGRVRYLLPVCITVFIAFCLRFESLQFILGSLCVALWVCAMGAGH